MKNTTFKVRLRPYKHRHNPAFEEQLAQVIEQAPLGSEIHITNHKKRVLSVLYKSDRDEVRKVG